MHELKLNVIEGIAGEVLQLAQPVVVKDISKFYYKFFFSRETC
jgi:hypothetical protein